MSKAYDCLKDEGYTHLTVNHSLNFVDPDTGAHTYMVGSKTKYALYRNIQRSLPKLSTAMIVASALWRRSFCKNIIKHIADFYEARKDAQILFPDRTTVCTVRDPIAFHGGKKRNTQDQHMGLNWRKEIRRKITLKDTVKVSNNFISVQFSFKAETHDATNRCDTSPRQVAATNRLV